MSLYLILIIAVFLLVFMGYIARQTSNLNRDYFKAQWEAIEAMASQKASWVQAIVDADKLLDEALKQSRYSGKTTGERMVSANRVFSDADRVWTAHKIRNKVVHESNFKLKKSIVNTALSGFKKALKDLGAL